ncbi:MAG: hypothetical protein JWR42_805 [Marmoricola sp.]|nr:hypothetical protein [Marmoricola sp.]
MTSPAQALAQEFAELHLHLKSDAHPDASAQRLVDLVCQVVPGCRWAGITSWPENASPHTAACSPDFPLIVDAIQYSLEEGPCMSAAAETWTSWAPDLTAETRWPRFTAAVLAQSPVRGALGYHLPGTPGRHALNLYSDRPDVFDQEAVAAGALFATHAGVLMAHARTTHEANKLEGALESNRLIGTAVGLLMATHDIPREAAFEALKRTSSYLNRKVRDIAVDVTTTRKLPRS